MFKSSKETESEVLKATKKSFLSNGFYFGFRFWAIFLGGFAVSNKPLRPLLQ